MEELFFTDFYKNNVLSDFFDTFKWNDIFGIASEESTDSSGTWDNDGFHTATANV